MSEDKNINEGHHVRAVTGGGHPRPVDSAKGWQAGNERGHQPASGTSEPSTGPTSPSGVSSANEGTASSPATESQSSPSEAGTQSP